MRHLLFLAGLACTVHGSVAQTVSGTISSPTIGSQEIVTYTLEISEADTKDIVPPTPPNAEGLSLVSNAASRSTSFSIANGNVSRSVSYAWRYKPEREGTARILEASVIIADETYTAPPVSITVVPQAQRPQTQRPRRSPFGGFFDTPEPQDVTQQDIFMRASQSSREAYMNEQITLEYRLYFRPGTSPRNTRLADSWDAEGFWREDLDVPENVTTDLVIENGVRYHVALIRRVAVFPTRAGELLIDPLKIAADAQSPNADPFLFSRSYSAIERSSPAINITSRVLPPEAPPGFTGAVGQYSLRADLSDYELDVGEALQMTVIIEGTGNIALIEAPQPEFPGIFEVYDPEVSTAKTERGNLITGSKTFTWLLIPRSNGVFQIPPIDFVFFDPVQEQYIVRSGTINPITITGMAPSTTATTSTASGFPVDDIAILKRGLGWTPIYPVPLHRHIWFYVLLLTPILGLGVVAILRHRFSRLSTDTAWARNRKAHPLARKHLSTAKRLLKDVNADEFYAALEQAVLGFLGNRLNIHERGITRAQLANLLSGAGVLADSQQKIVEFLDACDAARFAPIPAEYAQMEEHLAQASQILSSIAIELEAVRS